MKRILNELGRLKSLYMLCILALLAPLCAQAQQKQLLPMGSLIQRTTEDL